jgi:hypothetical protein
MFLQYIKNIIIKTYLKNAILIYFWHENMKNKALVTITLAPIFVNVAMCKSNYMWKHTTMTPFHVFMCLIVKYMPPKMWCI